MNLNLILKIILKWIDPFWKLNEEHFTFLLQDKHSGTFVISYSDLTLFLAVGDLGTRLVRLLTININKYEDLSYPKETENVDPILVTLFKIQPHYSQTSCENATPSSGTSPLASYKKENYHVEPICCTMNPEINTTPLLLSCYKGPLVNLSFMRFKGLSESSWVVCRLNQASRLFCLPLCEIS